MGWRYQFASALLPWHLMIMKSHRRALHIKASKNEIQRGRREEGKRGREKHKAGRRGGKRLGDESQEM